MLKLFIIGVLAAISLYLLKWFIHFIKLLLRP